MVQRRRRLAGSTILRAPIFNAAYVLSRFVIRGLHSLFVGIRCVRFLMVRAEKPNDQLPGTYGESHNHHTDHDDNR